MEEIAQAVPEEDPAPFLPAALRGLPAALALFACAYLLSCFLMYLSYTGRIRPPQAGLAVLTAFVGMTVAFLGWSGLWAAAGRIFRQKTYFSAHLSIASVSYIVWNALLQVVSVAAFSVDADAAFRPMQLTVFWLCGVWALTCHLGLASKLRHKTTLLIALLLVTAVCAGCLGFMHLTEKVSPGARKADFNLWPPAFRLVNGKAVPEYVVKLRELRVKADKAAADSEK